MARIFNLILRYGFDLIDSNENNQIIHTEWDAFFKAVFPEDI